MQYLPAIDVHVLSEQDYLLLIEYFQVQHQHRDRLAEVLLEPENRAVVQVPVLERQVEHLDGLDQLGVNLEVANRGQNALKGQLVLVGHELLL